MLINTYEEIGQEDTTGIAALLREQTEAQQDVTEVVLSIIEGVKKNGDAALVEFTERYDGVRLEQAALELPVSAGRVALNALDVKTRGALEKAAERIEAFSRECLNRDWTFEPASGITVGQVSRPLQTVGLYLPGGRFAYPSTVLMTGIPARCAGVKEIICCIPPGDGGDINNVTVAATALVGGCRVFRVGGAQAIAAMAYGTETVPKCLMVSGPGNMYVATAKRLVSGVVTVDTEAGPSEILIYADAGARASYVVADLMAQLEHDPHALAALITESDDLIKDARKRLEALDADSKGSVSLLASAGREQSLALINAIAPEHLELMVDDAESLLPSIMTAGCVFLGPWSAVTMGDYIAGPSHVLPTGGSAARLSGLSALDFTRTMNVVSYTQEGFAVDAEHARLLAGIEGLENHARSIEIRTGGESSQVEV